MLELQLRQQLSNVARRIGRLWMWRRLTWSWVGLTILLVGWAIAGRPFVPASTWVVIVAAVASFVWIRSRVMATPKTEVARQIEHAFPDLNSRLLAALEQYPDIETGRLNVLQRQVIAEAIHHSRMNDWADAVPSNKMTRAFLAQTLALASLIIVGAIAMQATSGTVAARSKPSNAANQPAGHRQDIAVEPGNAELERGTSLLVLARFGGNPPAEVVVTWKGSDEQEHQQSLTKSLDDPVFATRLPTIKENIAYRIEYDGQSTAEYQITVYDLPALVRSDIGLHYPSYTGLEPKLLEDAFDATVVEGTRVTVRCKVNKSLASAKLIEADQSTFGLQVDPADPTVYQVEITPTKRMRLKLHLADEAGRSNRDPEEFRIDVVPNRLPELKLAFPGKDVKVSPLEEVVIETSAIDDFGILEAGLVVQVVGRDPVTLPLGKDLKGGEKHLLSSIQRLEEFRVQPDELVTYYLYATDHGPDGQKRQTNSDVYFAEVRSFDEIYRQIDQQGAGEMQSSQKPPDSVGKLLELQKQIIIATWKLTRGLNRTWTGKSTEQLTIIRDSQKQALEKLEALRERLSQPQLQPTISSVKSAMEKAHQELEHALDEKGFDPLTPASAAEQQAYQGLLKLRSKEHVMVQSRAKGSGQQNEEMEKMDLELRRQQDRYESEKSGSKKEDNNVNREALAILDRLKELANRQEGLNQQLKDLEADMRQAKTDAEREEVERRLKRLREEQQQLLHDADDLRNKLNKSAQPEMVSETKQQLEQTRQRMVDTAEKLREGQVSQALTNGTRAERELKQLHEDFRKQTAAQFADAMRSLREDARQLADREQQLGEQLTQLNDDSRRTLRQSQERNQLQSEFRQQRQQTNDLVERAKHVVEQAETSEPLLAKQLYDTLRSTRESKLDQALNATEQLLKQGIIPEASKAEAQARTGIDQLKQGIEKAAESVLGNEVESLKRARRELAELSRQLEKEIDAQDPNAKGAAKPGTKPNPNANGQESQQNGQGNGRQPGKNPGEANADGQQSGQGQGDKPSDQQNGESGQGSPNSQNARDSQSAGNGQGKQAQGQNQQPGQRGQGQQNGQGQPNGQNPGQGQAPGQGQGQSQSPGEGQTPGHGQGQGQNQGQGQGQGSGTGPGLDGERPGGGEGPNGSSDATAPTTANGNPDDPQGPRRGPAGLRTPRNGGRPNASPAPGRREIGNDNNTGGSPGNSQGGPLTGGNFTEFNERLRDVESMISDPQLQSDVQKVRDRARSARAEFKRHTQTPNWELVRTSVHQPMVELQQRLADEIAKRESPDTLVPVDRDPVPTRYRDLVRSYYERLGSGKEE